MTDIDIIEVRDFVLARCEEDPMLPEVVRASMRGIAAGWSIGFADSVTAEMAEVAKAEKLRALRYLAQIWDGHPDFRGTWAFSSPGGSKP